MWDAAQWTGQVRLIQACHPVPTSVLPFDIWIRTRFGDALTYFRYQRFNTSANACASLGFSDTMGPHAASNTEQHPSIARGSAAQSHNFTPKRDKWLSESGREDTWFPLLSPQAWVRQYARHISAYVCTSVRPARQFVGTSVRQGAGASLAGATGTLGACGSLCRRTNGARLEQICVRTAITFCGMLHKFLRPLGLDLFVCKMGRTPSFLQSDSEGWDRS